MKKMKRCFLMLPLVVLAVLLMSPSESISQAMPAFRMQLTNGKNFSNKDLSGTKPVILIYFAPDCEHCQVLMDSLFKRINAFKNSQLVLVTFKPLGEVAEFEKHYKTASYNNIKVGMEVPIFFLRNYYQLQSTPFTALYDKKGKLVVSYKKETPVDDLLKQYKTLN